MTKQDKLIERLLSKPKDFSWQKIFKWFGLQVSKRRQDRRFSSTFYSSYLPADYLTQTSSKTNIKKISTRRNYKHAKTGKITMKDAMKYKGYFGSVHFNDEELVFHGKIEFIRALVTYEATDAKGLRKAFEEAVDDYLSTCKRNKIKPETSFKGSLNVRLGEDLHRRIALAAYQNDSTINKFIVETLNEAVK